MMEFARRGQSTNASASGHNILDLQMLHQQQLQHRSNSSNLRHLTGMSERSAQQQQIALPPGIFGGTTSENINNGDHSQQPDDSTQFQMKVEEIFRQWINIWNNPTSQRDPAAAATIAKLVCFQNLF